MGEHFGNREARLIALRRRWLRFNLRFLFLLIAAASILLWFWTRDDTPRVPNSDYPIINAVLNRIIDEKYGTFFVNVDTFDPIRLPSTTEPDARYIDRKLPTLKSQTLTDFFEKNTVTHRHRDRFDNTLAIQVRTKANAQLEAQRRNITHPVWVTISRPGIDPTGSQAVIFVVEARPVEIRPIRELIVLERSDTEWHVTKIVPY